MQRWQLLPLSVLVLITMACSTGGDGTGPPNGGGGGNPTITITLSSASLSFVQGANGSVTATIGRAGGFSGSVTITVEGLPAGMTATPAPATLASNVTTSTIDIAAGTNVTAGTYNLTIRASGSGVTAVTAALTVTLTAAQVGSFTLALSPSSLTIQQGAQANTTVNIARSGGFTGAVALTVNGAPTGMTATLNPANATGATSTLTIAVSGTVQAGNHTLTVRGTGTGVTEQSATLTVTVTASGGGGNVTWQFCAASGLPVWVAFQDGTGAWTRVTGVNNAYSFNLTQSRGAVAIAYTPANAADLDIFYGSQAELAAQGQSDCAVGGAATKTVNGSVVNVGAAEQAWVSLAGGFAAVLPAVSNNFTLTGVRDAPADLFAARVTIDPNTGSTTWNKGIIRRGINPANNATLPPLDFNAGEAFTPVTRNVTLNNLGGDMAFMGVQYYTTGGWQGTFSSGFGAAGASQQYNGVPAAVQQAGDLHLLLANAVPPGNNPTTTRTVMTMFRDAVDRTVTMGPVIANVAVSTASTAGGFARMRAMYTVQAEMNRFWSFSGSQAIGNASRTFTISVTSAYLSGAAMFDFTIPDFTTVAGWSNAWGPTTGSQLEWQFSAAGWTAPGGSFLTPFVEGGLFVIASRMGAITP